MNDQFLNNIINININLHQGCDIRDKRILELLLEIPGINVNVKNVSNNSPLHYFCMKWPDPDLSILDMFFKLKADVNVLNDSKETPLLKVSVEFFLLKFEILNYFRQ